MERHHRPIDVVAPIQAREFVERRHEVAELLRQGFAGAPWFEDISDEEALARVESHLLKPGFESILTIEDDRVVAGLWYDTPSLDELREERGSDLAEFAQAVGADEGVEKVIWQRETVVHPEYQGRGLATKLRQELIDQVVASEIPTLLLTRMRDDNSAVIAVASKFGYSRTGIRMSSSQNPNAMHEYWYRVVRNVR